MRTVTTLEYYNPETKEVETQDIWSHQADYHDYIDGTEISVKTYYVCPACGKRHESLSDHEGHIEDCYDE
jgi:hypothetical protein